ncbi:FAD-dependent oxidoreductase [Microbacterium sp. STN6]|uniref:FAD-dependent oxidoreductase n=1 Tax=Microbacterium sp. STN6 TaxID=2995588 RepID=UPI002260EF36|nr:FAD-dependent oxidoreductase [Microbacterium sp. STN6]MCX7522630.1 FAD-dependent oxidoreductase [Microbacterium sp. STN6]
MRSISVDCCIAGGGPAGVMLGVLLARAGLSVAVLEKHGDFFRDFRGDTIHPSTITLLGELGLRQEFLRQPHDTITTLDAVVNGNRLHPVDFGRLPAPDDFLVLMPQWDFLTFLAAHGRSYPGFNLHMQTEATGLIREGGRVVGVRATEPDGELEVRAPLTVAADGRASALRADTELVVDDLGVPVDVLWFSLPKPKEIPPSTLAYLDETSMVLTIDRGTNYQAGMVIRKGSFDVMKQNGLDGFRRAVAATAPFLAPVLGSITDWQQVKLLTVQIDRLQRWHEPGLLLIGDAAHAMSPAFGVGVNYAIQDAVAAANALVAPLRSGAVDESVLAGIQARRMPPVVRMQKLQKRAHELFAKPGGGAVLPNPAPAPLRWLIAAATPFVQRYAARVIGRGFRPEHLGPALREPQAEWRRSAD